MSQPGNSFSFDLSNFSTIAYATSSPYQYHRQIDGYYEIFEGAVGPNRFQYFKVAELSKAAIAYKQHHLRYELEGEPRQNVYDEWEKVLTFLEVDAIEKIKGPNAYLKYWNECKQKEEKIGCGFHIIQHFEALKDWYLIKLDDFVNECSQDWLTDEVRVAAISSWRVNLLNQVVEFLQSSGIWNQLRLSIISSYHAGELYKFYTWLMNGQADSTSSFIGKEGGDLTLIGKNGKIYKTRFEWLPIPEWVRNSCIINPFREMKRFSKDQDYLQWLDDLKTFYDSIPDDVILPALINGIEYAKVLLAFHMEHEHRNGYCSICESWERRLALANKLLKELNSKTEGDVRQAIKAPVIALFVFLVNESGLIKKGVTESVAPYCKRVCERYNLTYTDRVRQGFSSSRCNANLSKINEFILPQIDSLSRNTINEYLSS